MNIHAIGQVAAPMTTFYLALKLKVYPQMEWRHVGNWRDNLLPLAVEIRRNEWVYSVTGVACDVYRIVTGEGEWQSEWPITPYPSFKSRPQEARRHTLPMRVWQWLGYNTKVSPSWAWFRESVHESRLDHAVFADQIIGLNSRSKQVMDDIISLYGEVMASDIPTWR